MYTKMVYVSKIEKPWQFVTWLKPFLDQKYILFNVPENGHQCIPTYLAKERGYGDENCDNEHRRRRCYNDASSRRR